MIDDHLTAFITAIVDSFVCCQLQDLRGNIRVFCRCRYDSRTKCCLQFPSETEILPPNTKKPFQFNRVFDVKSTQEEVLTLLELRQRRIKTGWE